MFLNFSYLCNALQACFAAICVKLSTIFLTFLSCLTRIGSTDLHFYVNFLVSWLFVYISWSKNGQLQHALSFRQNLSSYKIVAIKRVFWHPCSIPYMINIEWGNKSFSTGNWTAQLDNLRFLPAENNCMAECLSLNGLESPTPNQETIRSLNQK